MDQEGNEENCDAIPNDIDDRELLQRAKEDGVLRRDYIATLLDPERGNVLASEDDPAEDVHVGEDPDIDPDDPVNMSYLLASEWTQAAPQSFCLNDAAWKNM